ncbi:hypothetical protein [Nocardioides guangzhouensis]|uniref:hypothetical protein n=1 Tax=Nocardioides guangzhouensis TaxID=2497878 RepID=UPI001438534B|nr:hypothetical protein [Nocardioides guangzhouensis]
MSLRSWGQLVAWLLGMGTLGALATVRLSGNADLTGYWFVAWGLVGIATGIAVHLRPRS